MEPVLGQPICNLPVFRAVLRNGPWFGGTVTGKPDFDRPFNPDTQMTQSRGKTARKGNLTMKQTLFLMFAVVLLVGFSGCCATKSCGPSSCLIDGSCGTCADCPETCQPCDTGCCGSCAQGQPCGCEPCATGCDPCGCEPCGIGNGKIRCMLGGLWPGNWCHGHGGGLHDRCNQKGYALMSQMDYPYYSLRGPRDFLAKNPPSIGP